MTRKKGRVARSDVVRDGHNACGFSGTPLSATIHAVPGYIWEISAKTGRDAMHAVVRTYSGKGAKELFDVLEKSKAEVEKLIRSVKGFVSYSLVRTADGGFSVSIAQDTAGADESVKKAKDWVKENAPTGASARFIWKVLSFFN